MAMRGPVAVAGFHTYIGPVLEVGHGACSSMTGATANSSGDCSHGASGGLGLSAMVWAGSIIGGDAGSRGGEAGCQGGFPVGCGRRCASPALTSIPPAGGVDSGVLGQMTTRAGMEAGSAPGVPLA
jgi:hypothetical protein